ncbi:hypothetical protein DSL72_007285 [Monilinia vaccinii-corymbosi]|uniref:Histone acetyltransferase GCN5 n=1 Tax=Monilinia vaccinii-corymbosi TaxID=61207 RepID=A0A8A3PM03_9HELO|nr:hypothetical protein DSL72_007285 [Monilinia vaccinii-corymbosi]
MESAAVMAEQIEFRVVKNDEGESSLITLAKFQELVQDTLPRMSHEAIRATIFDPSHTSFVMVKKTGGPVAQTEEVIAGIAYRVWEARRFVEMVYLVVDQHQHKTGLGTRLMNNFKDEVKSSMAEEVMEVLAYADNFAVGFFQKQGFTKEITLEKRVWGGIIKDYTQSVLMQCTLLPRMRYANASAMLRLQKEALMARIAAIPSSSRSDVVHAPPAQWQNGVIAPINPMDIPAIRESGWTSSAGPRPYLTPLKEFLNHLKTGRYSNAYLRSFLNSVDEIADPNYCTIIPKPMDFITLEKNLYDGLYKTPKAFVDDVKLIISNCRAYNDRTTIYYKHAKWLENRMATFIKSMPEWSYPVDLIN